MVKQAHAGGAETLMKFPCHFPIKVMGLQTDAFDQLVVGLLRRHVPDLGAGDLGEGAVQTRASSQGKYVSVTVTINATSQAQLDAIYQDLTDHDQVLMAL